MVVAAPVVVAMETVVEAVRMTAEAELITKTCEHLGSAEGRNHKCVNTRFHGYTQHKVLTHSRLQIMHLKAFSKLRKFTEERYFL